MDTLHKECDGLIETFSKNYGLCTHCGKEGYYKEVERDEEIIFVEFTQVITIRK